MAKEYKKSLALTQWSESDKPREKFIRDGNKSLSNPELIALLIRSGTVDKNAVEVARELLKLADNDLIKLGMISPARLMCIDGIGPAKAVTIAAALELGRRRSLAKLGSAPKIVDSLSAFEIIKPLLSDLAHEEFYVLYLNNSNKVISIQQLSKGGITSTVVDIRLILRRALEVGAVALILAHNHPSGNMQPSSADKSLTKKLLHGAKLMDLKVLDHLILTYNDYFSFADAELI